MTTPDGPGRPERDDQVPGNGNERSEIDEERPEARRWTPEEMEEAQPYPLPELPEEEEPRDRR